MRRFFFASLVSFSFTACATSSTASSPRQPPPPPQAVCAATGAILFGSDVQPNSSGMTDPVPFATFKLYDTGAWTYVETRDHKKVDRELGGCLAPTDVAKLREALASVPWTVTNADMTCMEIPTTFTHYTVNGKAGYTDAMCSPAMLDERSEKILRQTTTMIGQLTAPPRR